MKTMINVDHLFFFCQHRNRLLRARTDDGEEILISPIGTYSAGLSFDEVNRELPSVQAFEVCDLHHLDELDMPYSLTRGELEAELRQLVN